MHVAPHLRCALAIAIAALGTTAHAQSGRAIADLSLEDLLKVEVTSAARKAQQVADTPSAVFVITNDDIRRSGATHIADVLRLAPGVQVARINNNNWAVTIRGFNGRFANKLLVLKDGRSIYTPLFAGVYWEAADTVLEDIERIEVIRGPQAALWGANAVNGVINIITKSAAVTQGTLVSAAAGTDIVGDTSLRHGGRLGDGAHYRVYGRGFRQRPSSEVGGGNAADRWQFGQAGFRIDGTRGNGDRYFVNGEHVDSQPEYTLFAPQLTPPYGLRTDTREKLRQTSIVGRYERLRADGNDLTVQASYEHSSLDVLPLLTDRRDTFDAEAQQRLRLGAHDIVAGLSYRGTRDSLDNTPLLTAVPRSRSYNLFGAFVHDEITLSPDRFKLVLGSRFEQNSYTGFSMQPNGRFLWKLGPTQSVWAAASRAVRTPTRVERDMNLFLSVQPPSGLNPLPTAVNIAGSPTFGNEKVTAFELGYRVQPGSDVSIDLTAFENRYRNLRSGAVSSQTVVFSPVPYVSVVSDIDNRIDADTRGVEGSVEWKPLRQWRLATSLSLFRVEVGSSSDALSADTYRGSGPRRQLSLRSSYDVTPRLSMDVWYRNVSGLTSGSIPSYDTVDVRLAWQYSRRLELSLVGQNLLDDRHPEFATDFLNAPTYQIRRSGYVRAKWEF
jgi:iron complex outermembrane receptor protein